MPQTQSNLIIPIDDDDISEPHGFAYSKELEEQDAYFDIATQTKLLRAIAEAEDGNVVRFDPLRETVATAKARLNG